MGNMTKAQVASGQKIVNNIRSAFQNLSRMRPDLDMASGDLEWASWALGRMISLLRQGRKQPGLFDLIKAQVIVDSVREDIEGDNDGIPVNPYPLKQALSLVEPIMKRQVSMETAGTSFARPPMLRSSGRGTRSRGRKADSVISRVRVGSGLINDLRMLSGAGGLGSRVNSHAFPWAIDQLHKTASHAQKEVLFLVGMAEVGSPQLVALNKAAQHVWYCVAALQAAKNSKFSPPMIERQLQSAARHAATAEMILTSQIGRPR